MNECLGGRHFDLDYEPFTLPCLVTTQPTCFTNNLSILPHLTYLVSYIKPIA